MTSDRRTNLTSGTAPRDPEELEAETPAGLAEISPLTTLGPVHLTVANLDRSLDYYLTSIGLEVVGKGHGRCSLGSGARELLVLVEEPGAKSAAGYTGLYHFALLVPQRVDLARWLAHAARERLPLVGLSDHFVSEAIYLTDPDGHGIEIYWDRPREHWEGQVRKRMTTLPLDVPSLMREIASDVGTPAPAIFTGLPPGTSMGHVHLKVADIAKTVAFYRDVLGFALMAQLGPQAAFLSAGGYHHHLGANIWESAGAPPPPAGTTALRHVTIVLPNRAERDAVSARLKASGHPANESGAGLLVQDPAGNSIVLVVAG